MRLSFNLLFIIRIHILLPFNRQYNPAKEIDKNKIEGGIERGYSWKKVSIIDEIEIGSCGSQFPTKEKSSKYKTEKFIGFFHLNKFSISIIFRICASSLIYYVALLLWKKMQT
jgi:hypothetical protein